jgi:hypothetical protein
MGVEMKCQQCSCRCEPSLFPLSQTYICLLLPGGKDLTGPPTVKYSRKGQKSFSSPRYGDNRRRRRQTSDWEHFVIHAKKPSAPFPTECEFRERRKFFWWVPSTGGGYSCCWIMKRRKISATAITTKGSSGAWMENGADNFRPGDGSAKNFWCALAAGFTPTLESRAHRVEWVAIKSRRANTEIKKLPTWLF